MVINDDADSYYIALDCDTFIDSVNHPEWDDNNETFVFPWMKVKVFRDAGGKIFAAEINRRLEN